MTLQTRTTIVAGRKVTLYSRDGVRWSSNPRDLDSFEERAGLKLRGVQPGGFRGAGFKHREKGRAA